MSAERLNSAKHKLKEAEHIIMDVLKSDESLKLHPDINRALFKIADESNTNIIFLKNLVTSLINDVYSNKEQEERRSSSS